MQSIAGSLGGHLVARRFTKIKVPTNSLERRKKYMSQAVELVIQTASNLRLKQPAKPVKALARLCNGPDPSLGSARTAPVLAAAYPGR